MKISLFGLILSDCIPRTNVLVGGYYGLVVIDSVLEINMYSMVANICYHA